MKDAPWGREARRRELLVWTAVGLSGVAAWSALLLLPLGAEGGPVVCLFRRVTGVPCPGCGMTRAFTALAGGRWSEAIRFHPLAPLVAAQLVAAWGVWGAGLVRGRRALRMNRGVPWLALGNAAALLVVWGLRLWTGTLR